MGPGGGREDNDWGYDQVPNEGRSDIDKRDIGSDNGPDDGKSDRLDGNVDEWTGDVTRDVLLRRSSGT